MAAQPVNYHFISCWHIAASLETVWGALIDPAAWPRWWPGLQASHHAESPAGGPGDRADFIWRAPSGYGLHLSTATTSLQEFRRLDFTASGDLAGTGSCTLTPGPSITVIIRWDVATTKPWMNRFAWLLRPVFALNHRQLMSAGEAGLSRHLSAFGV
ncbi:MAG: SRPBCC family protein [Candidatus Saccharimonadales bacterium]